MEMIVAWKLEAFAGALRSIVPGPPKGLVARAKPDAEDRGEAIDADDLADAVAEADASDAFLTALGLEVAKWDCASVDEPWANGTAASTPERRALLAKTLGFNERGATALLARRPIYKDETLVITAPWEPWYEGERVSAHAFYWPKYCDYLLHGKKWHPDAVGGLDLATSEVIRRLADPTRPEAYQTKGLVVGYVQSGKTANFTGVAAKAVDAGYRLVIVMTGTIEMLRAQTQRRMDMEFVGQQNIVAAYTPEQALEAKVDYQDDPDWIDGKFLDLGAGPLQTEVVRLTTHQRDYQKQFKTLKIDRAEVGKPLYHADNLFRANARVAIVKKNSMVLKKLVSDLKANSDAFAEIPVLVIDDESDQASVNTVDPEKVRAAKKEGKEIKERRAINEQIALMLELMPRAQYVGYTATPFANVFADPSDPQGIFPKDFVIGLPRPLGYMGVDDFHDLDDETIGGLSNKKAYVRTLEASDDDADEDRRREELVGAIDMFILTGAVKLWREANDPGLRFRHHTMLIHESVTKDAHKEVGSWVSGYWRGADFSSPAAKKRLRELYDSDLLPVSEARVEPGVPGAPAFDEIAPFVPKAIGRIAEFDNNPVLVVNSDTEIQQQQQALDFDRNSTWRILVGGAKLSRGFTVEGLTITYFRRATNMSDSLTQMGRWFGFRPGYRDLVRLYIAKSARFGSKVVDLYKAFESVAVDEAAFRDQLTKYATWEDGQPQITPIEIPPLVSQHLPWLMPTAKNKMFNAELAQQSDQPFRPHGYPNNTGDLKANLDLWRDVLANAKHEVQLSGPDGNLMAKVGTVGGADFVSIVRQMRFLLREYDANIRPRIDFYEDLVAKKQIDDLLVFLPQTATGTVEVTGVGPLAVVSRERRAGRNGFFGEISDSKHRGFLEDFVAGTPHAALAPWSRDDRGAVLLYVAREMKPAFEKPETVPASDPERGLVLAFNAYLPETVLPRGSNVRQFRVRDPEQVTATIEVETA